MKNDFFYEIVCNLLEMLVIKLTNWDMNIIFTQQNTRNIPHEMCDFVELMCLVKHSEIYDFFM